MGVTDRRVRNMCLKNQRGVIERQVAGALKCAIDAHGPITVENRHSAAKRVIHMLKQLGVFKEGAIHADMQPPFK